MKSVRTEGYIYIDLPLTLSPSEDRLIFVLIDKLKKEEDIEIQMISNIDEFGETRFLLGFPNEELAIIFKLKFRL